MYLKAQTAVDEEMLREQLRMPNKHVTSFLNGIKKK